MRNVEPKSPTKKVTKSRSTASTRTTRRSTDASERRAKPAAKPSAAAPVDQEHEERTRSRSKPIGAASAEQTERPTTVTQTIVRSAASIEGRGGATLFSQPMGGTPHSDPRNLIAFVRFWEEEQRHRIRVGNMIGALERAGGDINPDLATARKFVQKVEDAIKVPIEMEWRKHPLYQWQQSIPGFCLHDAAVLVAMLDGDPYIAHPKRQITKAEAKELGLDIPKKKDGSDMERWIIPAGDPYPRTVSQLWAFCGVGKPGRREKGMSQEDALALGKPLLKARMRGIAERLKMNHNAHFEAVYAAARTRVEARNHEKPCPQCGGKGKGPAAEGTPWRDGHKHAHALRIVAKQFLLELWIEAKRIHEERGQPSLANPSYARP